jgi:hypothetical protein
VPELPLGGVKLTVALPLPPVTVTPVGVPGSAEVGATGKEGLEELLEPLPFVAVTVNVYPVPLVRAVTVIGEEVPVAVTGVPPPTGVAVTV